MKVEIVLSEDNINPSNVYLEGMKGYPNPRCQSTIEDHIARFQLPLRDFYECGVTRIVYKLNVRFFKNVYCHDIVKFKYNDNVQISINWIFREKRFFITKSSLKHQIAKNFSM